MAGLDPATHVLLFQLHAKKAWMPGSSGAKTRFWPGMTGVVCRVTVCKAISGMNSYAI
jgi:hypothetical protein